MANNIKGITVEIGGDTTPLNKALKDVNDTGKNLQDQLKEVNRQLKFDPNNTVLLQQKQELLAKEISNTSQKLDTLKEAEKQAQNQFAQGKISQEQYQALQREVIKTESQLKSLQKEAGLANAALNKISTVSGGIGKAATSIGNAMMPFTIGIAAAGTAAVAAYADVDKGTDTVIEKTGATGEAARDLEKVFKNVAGSVPDSMQEVGNAVGEINTRLGYTGEKLESASDDFLKFAKINGIDVNSSVQLVSRAMEDAGIAADDYQTILDQLTVASQMSGISMDTLTTDIAKYGAPMRALGLDTQNSIAMFAGWEKAGVNTEIAFSGMKKAIGTWGAANKDPREEFQKTLKEIKDAPDIATATQQAIEVFGQKAGPDLADAIQGGRFEIQNYIDALEKSGGAVENTYNGIVDGTDNAKTAMNAAKIAASEFGNTILTALAPILQKVSELIRDITSKISTMSDGTKNTILVIASVTAILAPTLLIIGKIAIGISNITKAMVIMKTATLAQTAAQTSWNAALLANPVTWIVVAIVAAIALLVAGIMHLWNTNEGFRTAVTNIWNGIKSVISGVVNAVVGFFTVTIPQAWNRLVAFMKQWGPLILTILAPILGIPLLIMQHWEQIQTFFVQLWNNIISFFTTTIPAWIASVIEWFNQLPVQIGQAIGRILASIVNFGYSAIQWVAGTLSQIITSIINWFSQLPVQIGTFLTNIVNNIVQWGANMVAQAIIVVPRFISKVMGFFGELPGKIWGFLSQVIANVVQWCSDLIATAQTEIPKFVSTVVGFIGELPGKMLEIGENIVRGIWDGINGAIDWLHDMIADFCRNIVDSFKDNLDIHSPSRLFADIIGKNIALGIGQGFANSIDAVIQSMASSIPSSLDTSVQVRAAMTAAYGGSAAVSSAQKSTQSTSEESVQPLTFQQYNQYYSPKALSPAEAARQTRNATRQIILAAKGV